MKHVRGDVERFAADPHLYRIVYTSVSIFDSAIALLGDPPPEGVKMPGPAYIACIRAMLIGLGVGVEEPFPFT